MGSIDRLSNGEIVGSEESIEVNAIRNKVNEIIDNVGEIATISDAPPSNPAEGDLWYDEGSAALYVYYETPISAWIQTNGNGGGGEYLKLKKADNSSLASNLVFQQDENKLKIYENGGAFRGVHINIDECDPFAGTNLGPGSSVVAQDSTPAETKGYQSWFRHLEPKGNSKINLPLTYLNSTRTYLVSIEGSWTSKSSFTIVNDLNYSNSILTIKPSSQYYTNPSFPYTIRKLNSSNILESTSVFAFDKNIYNINCHFLIRNCPAFSFIVDGENNTSGALSSDFKNMCVTDLGAGSVNYIAPAELGANNNHYFYQIDFS